MKELKMKNISVLLIIILIISLLHLPVFAEDGELLPDGSFEDAEKSAEYWLGGVIDPAAAYEGECGIQVSNPYGDVIDSLACHVLEYIPSFTLESGTFYTLSGYALNPVSDEEGAPSASASLRSGNILSIDVSNITGEWGFFEVSFTPLETGEYSLSLYLSPGDEDIGIFVDSLSLTESDAYPSYTTFDGPTEVFVPDNGYIDYHYSIVVYDENNLPVNVLIHDLDVSAEDLPDGVEFDEESGTLRVFSSAPANASFMLVCSASVGIPLRERELEVMTTKNLLRDSAFELGVDYWSGDISHVDSSLCTDAREEGEYGVFSAVSYTGQLLLYADKMYVFRAHVRSEDDFPASMVYISNLSFASSGYAEINITGIGGGEWSSVVSAFTVENTGLYELTINLYAPTERPIYLDDVYLAVEEPAPATISLHAPGNIQIPSDSVTLPCYAVLHDQLGRETEGDVEMLLSPERSGISLSGGEITVTNSARAGDYTVFASYGDIENYITLTVSENAVGDGGFEEKEPYEWWAASDGARFSIIDYAGSRWGYVLSDDSSCILVNNSYMELVGGEYYVFSASSALGRATVTAFIEDAFSEDYIPLCLFSSEGDALEPFSVDDTVFGRLVLYIEGEDDIVLALDDIDISPAELYVTDVAVSGGVYGDTLRGRYTYINNMSSSPDSDISSTRWYISDFAEGPYESVGAPNQSYLEFTSDMAGRYIIFEVTPICAETGLVGDSVRSEPLLVSAAPEGSSDDASEPPLAEPKPAIIEEVSSHSFSDIHGHWAEKRIASLAAAGIVSGRGGNRFEPDEYVTRAEFVAMLTRAFSLVPLRYSYTFSDVSESDWYSGAIEAAVRRDIVKGVGNGRFGPNEYVTREQMASFIYRAYTAAGGSPAPEYKLNYYDAYMISPWALDDVTSVTALGFFYGTDMHLFEPGRQATRAEAASVIYSLLRYFS